MKYCVRCSREQPEAFERCPSCGGELKRRRISEAINDLFEEEEKGRAAMPPCPRCGARLPANATRRVCVNCGASIRAADANGRPVLIRP